MSGEIPDVIGGETIAVAWGNPVKDRTLMRYTDVAERDSLIPTPVRGDVAFIDQWDVSTIPGQFASAITVYGGNEFGQNVWNVVWAGDAATYVPDTGGTFTGPVRIEGSLDLATSTLHGIAPTSLSTVSGNTGLVAVNQTSGDPNIGNATVFSAVSDTNRGLQIAVDASNGKMFVRGGTAGSWGTWVEMAVV